MAIAYVTPPVSVEQKAELRKDGFKLVDARFKPENLGEGDKVVGAKPKPKRTKAAS